jgi:hypothetical protein
MKSAKGILNTVALFTALTGTALADAHNGFGLNAGLASHSRDCGGCTATDTTGLSIGMDYQFALSDKLSVSPFLMSSAESTNVSDITVGHGIVGVQLRYWAGNMFFGGHLGRYSEVFTDGSASISGAGGGAGLVAGWENPANRWYVMGQIDSATVAYSGFADIKISGFRLSGGYRWK